MPRTNSHGACSRCKQRRKKCDEARPRCSACAKWNWICLYGSTVVLHPARSLLQLTLRTEESNGELKLPRSSQDEVEGWILRDIPTSIKAFFSPMTAAHIQSLQTLWQLMAGNELLRNALVACFSSILDETGPLTQLHQSSYDRTLRALRSRVTNESLDHESFVCVLASIVFLGKMESFGPNSLADPLEHWIALIPLLGSEQGTKLFESNILPVSEQMLILESLLYHLGTHALLSAMSRRAWQLWQSNRIYQRLCVLNPEGPNRLLQSAFLSGQYVLYNLAFRITNLLHSESTEPISTMEANDLEVEVLKENDKLDRYFVVAESPISQTESMKYEAEQAIYHLFCNSLLICITALRQQSSDQRRRMDKLVTSGLKLFLGLPAYGDIPLLAPHAHHFMLGAIWQIEILGCALYDEEQLGQFMAHFSILERYQDPGHRARARLWLSHAATLIRESQLELSGERNADESGRALPPGLILLRSAGKMEFREKGRDQRVLAIRPNTS